MVCHVRKDSGVHRYAVTGTEPCRHLAPQIFKHLPSSLWSQERGFKLFPGKPFGDMGYRLAERLQVRQRTLEVRSRAEFVDPNHELHSKFPQTFKEKWWVTIVEEPGGGTLWE